MQGRGAGGDPKTLHPSNITPGTGFQRDGKAGKGPDDPRTPHLLTHSREAAQDTPVSSPRVLGPSPELPHPGALVSHSINPWFHRSLRGLLNEAAIKLRDESLMKRSKLGFPYRIADSRLNSRWNSDSRCHNPELELCPHPRHLLVPRGAETAPYFGFLFFFLKRSSQRSGAFRCKLRYFCLGEEKKKIKAARH